MDPKDEYRLSFYKEIGDLSDKHGVKLVKHVESGSLFVKKELKEYDLNVFRILAENHFDGIPEIVDFAEDRTSGTLIVIEEFIQGKTLRNILNVKKTLPEDQAVSVIKALCDTLKPLHSLTPPLIHRDIKPENIILTDDARLYLVDFDASKLYSAGKDRDTELIGTRRYAAPEQYGYSQSDPRTDIYAIGKVGIEMITGDPSKKPDQLSGPVSLVLSKCIDMDPDDRYDSVEDLKLAVSGIRISKYALPGFRTKKLWKEIVASVFYASVYLFTLYHAWKNEEGLSTPELALACLVFLLDVFCLTFLYTNYLGIASKLPLTRSKNIILKLLGYYIYSLLIVGFFSIITSPILG